MLRAFASFLAGVNRYNWEKFFLFNAAGAIVWASIFGAGGDLLGHAFEHYARPGGRRGADRRSDRRVFAARFMRYHERALEEEAEKAFPGPLVKPNA